MLEIHRAGRFEVSAMAVLSHLPIFPPFPPSQFRANQAMLDDVAV
jgi:hypothetical protein